MESGLELSGYSAYVPKYRISRAQVGSLIGQSGRGSRAIANFDEDATTMAVEAAHPIVAAQLPIETLWLATTTPPYLDKTNAAALHAALGLADSVPAFDLGANYRSGLAALIAAGRTGGLAVMSDVREGKAGGADERDSGDAAAAFSFGKTAEPAARVLGVASRTAEFLDRWRLPTAPAATTWEERFGQSIYDSLGRGVAVEALKQAGVGIGDVTGVLVTSPNVRAARLLAASLQKEAGGARTSADLVDLIGNSGAAQFGLELADQLDRAEAGDLILAVSLADGADAMVFEVSGSRRRVGIPVRDQLDGTMDVDYAKYLLWRGRFVGETPKRPDPTRPSSPYSARNAGFKFSFQGGRCRACGTVQYPLPRVCLECRAVDDFDIVSTAGRTASVVTYTVDRLAFTANPPLIGAVIDMDGGGRIQCELTDVDPNAIAVGDAVVMTFRRLSTVDGIHNYFWKARPGAAAVRSEEH